VHLDLQLLGAEVSHSSSCISFLSSVYCHYHHYQPFLLWFWPVCTQS